MRPVLVLTLTVLAIPVALAAPADRFERISPSKAGYDVEGLLELESFLREKGSSSLLLLKDGKVFFEYGDIRKPHLVHSIRKALLNSLVGIAVHQGEINLDATLEDLGVDDVAPSLTDRERQARVIDLLESRSGVYHPATAESPGMLAGKPPRGSHAPGSHFYYNNWDFNAAGGIYEQLTGRRIFDDFQSRIAEPLGMLDYQGRISTLELPTEEELPEADGIYQFERALSDYPAYHFRLSTHDLALYGQLFLQRGQWKGQQLVPAQWIDESTQPRSIRNAEYGLAYGRLWYVLVPDENQVEPPSYYHTGTGVHMLGIYPEHGLVMVHRVDTESAFTFNGGDLLGVIRLIHGARKNP